MTGIAMGDRMITESTVTRAAAGDELACARLVDEHHRPMVRAAYVITGDIRPMWLRDSVGQVQPFLHSLYRGDALAAAEAHRHQQELACRRHRADAETRGLDAGMRMTDEPREPAQAQRMHPVASGKHHRGRAVVDARGVAGSYRAVRLERGLHLRKHLDGGVGLLMLVGVELRHVLAGLHHDRDDLLLEAACRDRRRGAGG